MSAPEAHPVHRGPLLIVSGPSGTGKSTLVKRMLQLNRWPLRLSISATTRSPRPGETQGQDYYFWTKEQFEAALAAGEFLEHALVHGEYYGTLAREVGPYRDMGWGVILEIDVQGARQVWEKCTDYVSIFVRTSDPAVYEERLRQRNTEDEAGIQRRMRNAQGELSHVTDYPYHILNDDLEQAARDLASIVDTCFRKGN